MSSQRPVIEMKNQSFRNKLSNAFSGIIFTWRNESNFRRQIILAIFTFAFFLVLRPDPLWWALIILCVGLVLATEMINSAIEALIDYLHPEIHPAIGKVKDVMAGMVLILSLTTIIIAFLAIYDSLI